MIHRDPLTYLKCYQQADICEKESKPFFNAKVLWLRIWQKMIWFSLTSSDEQQRVADYRVSSFI